MYILLDPERNFVADSQSPETLRRIGLELANLNAERYFLATRVENIDPKKTACEACDFQSWLLQKYDPQSSSVEDMLEGLRGVLSEFGSQPIADSSKLLGPIAGFFRGLEKRFGRDQMAAYSRNLHPNGPPWDSVSQLIASQFEALKELSGPSFCGDLDMRLCCWIVAREDDDLLYVIEEARRRSAPGIAVENQVRSSVAHWALTSLSQQSSEFQKAALRLGFDPQPTHTSLFDGDSGDDGDSICFQGVSESPSQWDERGQWVHR